MVYLALCRSVGCLIRVRCASSIPEMSDTCIEPYFFVVGTVGRLWLCVWLEVVEILDSVVFFLRMGVLRCLCVVVFVFVLE